VRERDVDRAFVAACRRRKIQTWKLSGMGRRGLPDRLICGPGERHALVELKAEAGRLTTLQALAISILRSSGLKVYVLSGRRDRLDTARAIDAVLREYLA
jgi:hypothetical protein